MTVLVLLVLVVVAGALGIAVARVRSQLADAQRQVRDLQAGQERRRRADDLVRSRLEHAIQAIEHGIAIYDEHGEVVYSNDTGAAFLPGRHGDVLVEQAINALARRSLRGHSGEHELEVFGPPRRILHLRAVPLGDPEAPAGALVIVEDASTRRRLEKVRSDFVANISHELKTPVGAMALLAETLLGEDDPEVIRRLAERIGSEAFRVGNTIEDLLELSRLEASPSSTEEELEVATFVSEAVERVRPAAQQRRIHLDVEEISHELRVYGERRQLVSAVANLLDNAVKYSETDSKVELRARRLGESLEVQVQDHGIGIPRRDLERIFERFYRVDRARSRETGGTGLGLAIVRHVASNHRGEVRVESREGEGSRFTLRLPAVRTKEPA